MLFLFRYVDCVANLATFMYNVYIIKVEICVFDEKEVKICEI